MASQRMQRVQNLLRSEISTVIQRKLKDPRVTMVTISRLQVSPDLREARVFISAHGASGEQAAALEGLRSASGFIRQELMKVLHLRPVPHLEFEADLSLARAARTLDLLEQIRHEQEHRHRGVEPGGPADPEQ
jgi:ribosome-binding factor A